MLKSPRKNTTLVIRVQFFFF